MTKSSKILAITSMIALLPLASFAQSATGNAEDGTGPDDKVLSQIDYNDEYIAANITPEYDDEGKWYTVDDIPTYKIEENGDLDWPSYSGFRRYNSECFVCHGPDGEGSTYAPALKDSALIMDYYDFVDTVVNGRQNVSNSNNQVMPNFGTNVNVMCYLDDIYVYLKGRGMGAIPRGRPAGRVDKTDAIREAEESCLGT